jgi:hypothetical protein
MPMGIGRNPMCNGGIVEITWMVEWDDEITRVMEWWKSLGFQQITWIPFVFNESIYGFHVVCPVEWMGQELHHLSLPDLAQSPTTHGSSVTISDSDGSKSQSFLR